MIILEPAAPKCARRQGRPGPPLTRYRAHWQIARRESQAVARHLPNLLPINNSQDKKTRPPMQSTSTAKIVVLHSGGMDSTVCLLMAVNAGHDTLSLGIDYGQRHRVEMDFAANQCERLGVERRIIGVRWTKPTRPIPTCRTVEEMPLTVSPAFLPARNVIFLSLAAGEAAGVGASEIWAGFNAVDYSGYPDCTPEFVRSYQQMLSVAVPNDLTVTAPLISWSKADIAQKAAELGLGPDDTWSCYRPTQDQGTAVPCGSCDACVLHQHAWAHVNAPSPTEYVSSCLRTKSPDR